MRYNVLKRLHNILLIRFDEEETYEREIENMQETLDETIVPHIQQTLHLRNQEYFLYLFM